MSDLPGTDDSNLTITSRLEKLIQQFEEHIRRLELKNNASAGGEADQDQKSANSVESLADTDNGNGEVDET